MAESTPSRLSLNTIAPVLGALAGVVVPVALFFFARPSRDLTLTQVATAPVVSGADSLSSVVQVTVRGLAVASVWVTTLSLRNNGTEPLKAEDFERPLEVVFGTDTKIVTSRVSASVPRSLTPLISADSARVQIAPLLLNPGDEVRFVVYTVGSQPRADLVARVAGVHSPTIAIEDGTLGERVVMLVVAALLSLCSYAYSGVCPASS